MVSPGAVPASDATDCIHLQSTISIGLEVVHSTGPQSSQPSALRNNICLNIFGTWLLKAIFGQWRFTSCGVSMILAPLYLT